MEMKNLVKLRPIDVRKCETVNDIIKAMRLCSFGARMLGEVTDTIDVAIMKNDVKPIVLYDGKEHSALGELFRTMKRYHLLSDAQCGNYGDAIAMLPEEALVIVVGAYSGWMSELFTRRRVRPVFINEYGMAPHGYIEDGHFTNAVFADPRFVMPMIYLALMERHVDPFDKGIPYEVPNAIDWIGQFGGLAREVKNGAETLRDMVFDKDCTVFLTASGAMTVAQMSLLFCDLIDESMVQGIASTGALMAHGLIQSVGLSHFKYNPHCNDAMLARHGINRVTDTLEPETNFDHLERVLSEVFAKLTGKNNIGSVDLHRAMGEHLFRCYKGRGILKSAYENDVPVFVPAVTDSEIWNDIFTFNRMRELRGRKGVVLDMEKDSKELVKMALAAKKLGIFSIGGGVPRNNVQNVAPLIELMGHRLGENMPTVHFSYGCRIAPDPMYLGHLSGCTYSEGASWRKMDPHGQFSEMHTDATIVLPFLVKYLLETVQ